MLEILQNTHCHKRWRLTKIAANLNGDSTSSNYKLLFEIYLRFTYLLFDSLCAVARQEKESFILRRVIPLFSETLLLLRKNDESSDTLVTCNHMDTLIIKPCDYFFAENRLLLGVQVVDRRNRKCDLWRIYPSDELLCCEFDKVSTDSKLKIIMITVFELQFFFSKHRRLV